MPAVSKSQQRLMGMVHAYKQGKLKNASEKVKKVAQSISDEDAIDFAKSVKEATKALTFKIFLEQYGGNTR